MLVLCLLTVLGLAMADRSHLCGGGQCPAGWRNIEGDCVMFMSRWQEVSPIRRVCRAMGAEYSEFFLSRSEADSATRHSLPVCVLCKEAPTQGMSHIESKVRRQTGGGPDISHTFDIQD